ncbi:hypothetical protein Y032_0042g635 [Ancylostoma ceylanicum]|uniref:Uncharacterized protein n=1 Tax=Ancylostoma ceylanicum TaxID=53326 RepID=A0A016UGE0_9BILA|nr:hypothetical protein Y032_0042g635 [Ancylostoma ceylanicum]
MLNPNPSVWSETSSTTPMAPRPTTRDANQCSRVLLTSSGAKTTLSVPTNHMRVTSAVLEGTDEEVRSGGGNDTGTGISVVRRENR